MSPTTSNTLTNVSADELQQVEGGHLGFNRFRPFCGRPRFFFRHLGFFSERRFIRFGFIRLPICVRRFGFHN